MDTLINKWPKFELLVSLQVKYAQHGCSTWQHECVRGQMYTVLTLYQSWVLHDTCARWRSPSRPALQTWGRFPQKRPIWHLSHSLIEIQWILLFYSIHFFQFQEINEWLISLEFMQALILQELVHFRLLACNKLSWEQLSTAAENICTEILFFTVSYILCVSLSNFHSLRHHNDSIIIVFFVLDKWLYI